MSVSAIELFHQSHDCRFPVTCKNLPVTDVARIIASVTWGDISRIRRTLVKDFCRLMSMMKRIDDDEELVLLTVHSSECSRESCRGHCARSTILPISHSSQ